VIGPVEDRKSTTLSDGNFNGQKTVVLRSQLKFNVISQSRTEDTRHTLFVVTFFLVPELRFRRA
jgi:hypothetical protein